MMIYLVRHAAPAGIAGKWSLYEFEPHHLAVGDEIFEVEPDKLFIILSERCGSGTVRYSVNDAEPGKLVHPIHGTLDDAA